MPAILTMVRQGLALVGLILRSAPGAAKGSPEFLTDATTDSPQVFGHPKAGFDYPKYDGFTLTLAEEFEKPIDLDKDPIWTWSDGGLGEGQVRFVEEAIKFKDDKLILEAKETEKSPLYECSHANAGTPPGPKNLTSGELRTRRNMFRYGRYEVSMKAPTVQPGNTTINGNYIATMFVYKDASARHWREVDIEVVGNAPDAVVTNVLYADNASRWYQEMAADAINFMDGVNVRESFNTYAFEWLPDSITFYFNGKEFRKYNNFQKPGVGVPELPGKIMLSLWIFEGPMYWFGGLEGNNNQYPMSVEYDWFRYYKWDGDDKYPCNNLADDCLTEDDLWTSGNNPCDGIEQEGFMCSAECIPDRVVNDEKLGEWFFFAVGGSIVLVLIMGAYVFSSRSPKPLEGPSTELQS